jgi:hypothetical protein
VWIGGGGEWGNEPMEEAGEVSGLRNSLNDSSLMPGAGRASGLGGAAATSGVSSWGVRSLLDGDPAVSSPSLLKIEKIRIDVDY